MNPRKPLAKRQNSAHRVAGPIMSFATSRGLGKTGIGADGCRTFAFDCKDFHTDCYPFLPLWLGPARVEPFFRKTGQVFRKTGQGSARIRQAGILGCSARSNALNSGAITTLKRGRSSCSNLLSSWLSCPPPCRAVWKTMVSAPWPVRQLVPVWRVPPAMIRRRADLSALVPVRCAATRACADRTARRLTGRAVSEFRTIRGATRVAFCIARPAEGADAVCGGNACSRKS